MSDATSGTPVLEVREVTKRFGAVVAVDSVSLRCAAGEVVAVVGENGAGKSTLLKLVSGIQQPDAGEVLVDGERVQLSHPLEARRRGIAIIHQELALLPERDVAQNVLLGREPRRGPRVDRRALHEQARAALERLGAADAIPTTARIGDLPVARRQLVEIARALSQDARVLLMDEPTAALNRTESDRLLRLVDQLRADGVGIVYISHRLEEVLEVADRVVVLRDGEVVASRPRAALTEPEIVRLMVGRELDEYFPPAAEQDDLGEVRLVVREAATPDVGPISFTVRAGEILGIGGLEGAGQQELAEAVFGVTPLTGGEVVLDGESVSTAGPRGSIAAGLGYVTADRKGDGLVLGMSIADNAELTARAVGTPDAAASARARLAELDVRMAGAAQAVGELSGGNQQKVVLAKWLTAGVGVLVLHEPTRGIDVGSKAAIHDVLRELARDGMGIVMISSDLPELLGASDRLLVLRAGGIAGELPRGVGEDQVMALATGVSLDDEVSA